MGRPSTHWIWTHRNKAAGIAAMHHLSSNSQQPGCWAESMFSLLLGWLVTGVNLNVSINYASAQLCIY